MGANPYPLPTQTHSRRKTLVVRKGGNMTKSNKRTIGQDWTAILKKAGIPEPPGYRETVDKLYPKENSNAKHQ